MSLDRNTITRDTTVSSVSRKDDSITARVWHGPRDEFLEFSATTGRSPWGYTNEQNEGNSAECNQTELSISERTTDSRGRGRRKHATLCLSRDQGIALRDLLLRAYPVIS